MAKAPPFTTDDDRHLVFNASRHNLKCYRRDGTLEWDMEAHGEGTGGDSSLPKGNTPPGLYRVDRIELTAGDPAYGPYAIKLDPIELDKGGTRDGIYIHGGGSGLKTPSATQQGWRKTHGCIRVQNGQLGTIVNKVRGVQGRRGQVWVTVKWW
jgi:hypothetical protein